VFTIDFHLRRNIGQALALFLLPAFANLLKTDAGSKRLFPQCPQIIELTTPKFGAAG
jgi:hypothetical protein